MFNYPQLDKFFQQQQMINAIEGLAHPVNKYRSSKTAFVNSLPYTICKVCNCILSGVMLSKPTLEL